MPTLVQLPNDSLDGLVIWIVVLLIIFTIVIPVFELLRKQNKFLQVFYTRITADPKHSFPLPKYPFQWILTVYKTPEQDIMEKIGLDGIQFLRFLRMCFFIFAGLFIGLFIFLIPDNFFANDPEQYVAVNVTDTTVLQIATNSLTTFSIINIQKGSNLLWIHLFFTALASFWILFMLRRGYLKYAKTYTQYMSNMDLHSPSEKLQHKSIIIKNLTDELSTESNLRSWLQSLELGPIKLISLNTNKGHDLWKKYQQHEKVVLQLEAAYMHWASNVFLLLKYREFGKLGFLTSREKQYIHKNQLDQEIIDEKQDSIMKCRPIMTVKGQSTKDVIKYYLRYENDLMEEILMERTKTLSPNIDFSFQTPSIWQRMHLRTTSAFVTFENVRSSVIAQQILLHSKTDETNMIINQAPPYDQVIWDNLNLSAFERLVRKYGISLVSLGIAGFWIIPSSFISSLTDLPKLYGNPAFKDYVEYLGARPWLYTIISSIGPPIFTQISINFMPYVFEGYSSLM